MEEDIKIDSRDLLNTQTARIEWEELQRHFARGVVIRVDPALDLIHVASQIIDDNKEIVEAWMKSGQVANATDDDARHWTKIQPSFWAVVVAPWVLVQIVRKD